MMDGMDDGGYIVISMDGMDDGYKNDAMDYGWLFFFVWIMVWFFPCDLWYRWCYVLMNI